MKIIEQICAGVIGFVLAMILAFALAFPPLAFPDDVTNFKQEQAQLQQRAAQYQQIAQNIQVRLIQLDALIRYAEKQKEEKKVEKVAEETTEEVKEKTEVK